MEYVRVSFVLVCVLVCYTTAGNTRQLLQWLHEEDRCRTPDGGSGTCINLNDCKIITNFVASNDNLGNDVKGALRKYVCDSRNNVKVCCPSKLPDSWVSKRIEDHSQHRNIKLLPENCGTTFTSYRIINGNETGLYEFPWAAVLKYNKEGNPFSCGASLISDRYVLTAAHCIRSRSELIGVRLGEHDLNTNPDCELLGGKKLCVPPHQDFDISVNDAIVHPEYSSTQQHDIALIRLRSPAKINIYSVRPVCLPITMPEKTHKFEDYTVIGWGATESGISSPVLLKVLVPRVEISKCAPLYETSAKLTDNQVCAGGKNEQDSCIGDSGGPLLVDYTADGRFRSLQYGIVSFGPRICGKEGFPTVYTRVDKYVGWILDNIKP